MVWDEVQIVSNIFNPSNAVKVPASISSPLPDLRVKGQDCLEYERTLLRSCNWGIYLTILIFFKLSKISWNVKRVKNLNFYYINLATLGLRKFGLEFYVDAEMRTDRLQVHKKGSRNVINLH